MSQQQKNKSSADRSHQAGTPGLVDPRREGAIKDPKDWTTGDEPMTGSQESYLDTLGREAGEEVPPDLTKAEASEKIDELRHKTGRDRVPSKSKTVSDK